MNENISQQETIEQSAAQIETSNIITSDIENMEVHKHPHHVMHTREWGEHMLKFFMLFFAVFLSISFVSAQNYISAYTKKVYMIPVRDGIKLNTVVYAPANDTATYPILIQRTP